MTHVGDGRLERMAREDPRGLVRLLAPSALLPIEDLTFAAEIAGRLIEDSELVRPALVALLDRADPVVREGAILGLAHHGHASEDVLWLMRGMRARDPSPGVRAAASDLLASRASAQLSQIEDLARATWPSDPLVPALIGVLASLDARRDPEDGEEADRVTIPRAAELLAASIRGRVDERVDERIAEQIDERISERGDGARRSHADVFRAMCRLESERIGLVDLCFEFRTEDDAIDLDPRVVADAIRGGELRDPRTGQLVPDWERRVVPCFAATPALRQIWRDLSPG